MTPLLHRLLLACLLALAAPAWAHLMPAQQGTIRLVGERAYVLVSLPASAFAADDDGDGSLSLQELRTHAAALEQRAARGFRLLDGEIAARPTAVRLVVDGTVRQGPGAHHLVLMATYVFDKPPAALRVETDLFGKADEERRLALRALRDERTEPVVLTPVHPAQKLFQPAWQALGDFVLLGAEHILLGADHLLFLLTVLVAGAGWRYWLAVITSFTAAHSLTLALAAFGWVQLPASIAEPLIAASIVAVAWDNLRRDRVRLAQRSAIVFACGLVHGLGFARALEALGASGPLWTQLAGFNLGVELGQVAFVAAALAAMALLGRVVPAASPRHITRAASWTAAGLGGLLLVRLLAA